MHNPKEGRNNFNNLDKVLTLLGRCTSGWFIARPNKAIVVSGATKSTFNLMQGIAEMVIDCCDT
jgi:hypothetical protein